jgi:GTP diphosphokinase / guanosine-3',5'-bis(diphosphate) 3'-diphosphatase
VSTLERAIAIACKAHAGQVDKAGQPYILHPFRLMLRMSTEAERITAVLHDVVEDSAFTLEDLMAERFALEVVRAVDALSRREGEEYMEFVRRAAADPIAGPVKRVDLEDNLDLTRIPNPSVRDLERMRRYQRALENFAEREAR